MRPGKANAARPLLGIIGGMGPLASVYFYEILTKMQQYENEQEQLNILLYSKPSIPDRTAFITKRSRSDPFESMLEAGRGLEAAGVSHIAVPCVTAHFFYRRLTEKIKTPVINILREAADDMARRGIKKAGLLATEGTLAAGLFNDFLAEKGIEAVTPPPGEQRILTRIIYEGLKRGASAERGAFFTLAENLRKKGADTVVLGCTELSLAARDFELNEGYTDVLAVLARASLKACGAAICE